MTPDELKAIAERQRKNAHETAEGFVLEANEVDECLSDLAALLSHIQDIRRETAREIVEGITKWLSPSHMRLHAGEMSRQEVRTVEAILTSICASIRTAYGVEG